jgi:hypothetical protein
LILGHGFRVVERFPPTDTQRRVVEF